MTNQPVTGQQFSYDYNLIGNRLFSSAGAQKTTYGANTLNQYTATTNPAQSFGYDEDGNMINWVEGTNRLVYTWDAENRLVGVEPMVPTNNANKLEFTYDYMGRRVQKVLYCYQTNVWRVAADQRFVYDGWNMIQQWTTSDANQTTNFVWGLDLSQSREGAGGIGGLLMMATVQGTTTHRRAYVYDGNGNVGQVLEMTNGAISAHYEYNPYGNLTRMTGAWAAGNPYRFSTKYLDTEALSTAMQMYYYGYRFYHPELGRWLNRDPIRERGGLNLYAFVRNLPVAIIDKLGLAPFVNNCNRPIPFKPEDDLPCGVKEDKKYDCPPGMTCDVDGVYPPDGGNPIKIVDGCSAECNEVDGEGQLTIQCDDWWSWFKQWYGGGPVPDDFFDDHPDWPRPDVPSEPLPPDYNPFPG